jgi:hypothetical protein
MRKLITLLVLLFASFASSPGQACTDPRPIGTAGSNAVPMGAYIVGMTGYGDSIKVFYMVPGSSNRYSQLIHPGPDTGITFTGGYNAFNYAGRIVSVEARNGYLGTGGTWRTYLRINGTHDLEFVGSDGLIGNVKRQYRGTGGGLTRVYGWTKPSPIHPGQYDGQIIFNGIDNGASDPYGAYTLLGAGEPGYPCTEPEAALQLEPRAVRLARSFFEEPRREPREWWQTI